MNNSLLSSNKQDWNTPQRIIDLVNQINPIGLDPCSNPTSIVNATTNWSIENRHDGLLLPWTGYGLIYVNPPYGREIEPWVRKATTEYQTDKLLEIVMLVPARTDTCWFRYLWDRSNCVCFVAGRLKFSGHSNSAPFPSAVFYMGPNPAKFVKVFSTIGKVI